MSNDGAGKERRFFSWFEVSQLILAFTEVYLRRRIATKTAANANKHNVEGFGNELTAAPLPLCIAIAAPPLRGT